MINKLEIIQHKITQLPTLQRWVKEWRLKSQTIVFTNGCFDILHKGHIKVLAKAAEHGQKLIVALNTDASVKRLKGSERPLNAENDRALVIAALQYVDAVILFDEDTPQNLINSIVPDVLVKGGDYTIDKIIGAEIVLQNQGQVIIVPTEEGYATTNIINKIKNP